MLGKLDPRNEPISVSTIVTVVTLIGTWRGLDMDPGDATAIATVVFFVGQWVARSLSVPVKKHDKIVEEVIDAKKVA